ncbi:DUF2059 domain-containing protein [Aureimonas glaciei]|jgi:hypothetical protein|uniref:DUF2059 domain-containing protein n=1 Tax=Aureimonas glaciei TaxID=1776957 RepID=A0A917DAG2_9HYPH|nr:DUF2059 domain-containing protein [Aureimonas glaciei]GGD17930.1 hypothetical protein GCM10011335_20910 [Aureimonas glaciei]
MVLNEMMRRGLLALTAAGLMAIAPAKAQDATPEHLSAARAAVAAIDSTDQFDNILMNAATQIKADLIGNNPNIQSEISDMVDDRALALAPRRADLENEVARIYARLFTEQELKDIAAFYESAAGKKLIAQGPVASREVMAAADVWSNGIVRDLRSSAAEGMASLAASMNTAAVPLTDPAAPATPTVPAIAGDAGAAGTTTAQ